MVSLHFEPSALFFFLFTWHLLVPALAGIVNRTIDDGFGDSQTLRQVTYFPTGSSVWQDATCSGCSIRPDTSRAFKGTYTAATYNPNLSSMSITMKFNGTAIYIFFILANNAGDGITSLTMANFTLNRGSPELFQHAPDLSTTDIDYNQLVYSKQDLINAEHTLVISTSGVNSNVFVNFDYAIYTHDDDAPLLALPSSTNLPISTRLPASSSTTIRPSPSSTTSSDTKGSPPVGPIIGGVIGGVVLLALLVFLLVFLRRRRGRLGPEGYAPPPLMGEMQSSADRQAAIITPFNTQQTHLPSASTSKFQQVHNNDSSTAFSYQMSKSDRVERAYGGYIDFSANSTSESGTGRQNHSQGTPFFTNGDLSSSDTAIGLYPTTVTPLVNSQGNRRVDPSSVETIRRARQNEIDRRLQAVQQEMTHLTSDLRGEKEGRQLSVRRRRTITQGNQEGGEEGEMSMAEMREQLRVMQEQIEYLREQQRSAWAQGLSDDPPPGYTPRLTMISGYSDGPTTTTLS